MKKNSPLSIRRLFVGKFFAMCRWALKCGLHKPNDWSVKHKTLFFSVKTRVRSSGNGRFFSLEKIFRAEEYENCIKGLFPLNHSISVSHRAKNYQSESMDFYRRSRLSLWSLTGPSSWGSWGSWSRKSCPSSRPWTSTRRGSLPSRQASSKHFLFYITFLRPHQKIFVCQCQQKNQSDV